MTEEYSIGEVEEALTDVFDEHAKVLMEETYTHPEFKRRQCLIDDAYKAHSEGRYALSIPVMLAQVVGIGFPPGQTPGHAE